MKSLWIKQQIKTKILMKNFKKLTKSDLKTIEGGWVPPEGGRCPNGTCQYSENGPCRIYNPDKCY
ncbi:bacteriocin-type signal sequence-containing protein [Chryseobacterium vrystaatense]|uniref:Bacteriocin-type signal sequence-containing protein n=1 Tax=Chryseobacterium vrystaatense TaxID=307480 RepID=A0A1M5GN35_9FLAO|nr:bacteriocin-type signal sequence-containing protein [Chryseobacterium vrystaatense]